MCVPLPGLVENKGAMSIASLHTAHLVMWADVHVTMFPFLFTTFSQPQGGERGIGAARDDTCWSDAGHLVAMWLFVWLEIFIIKQYQRSECMVDHLRMF